jgi:1-acyl-sn-glycerol-3-phosphate acyltransferase
MDIRKAVVVRALKLALSMLCKIDSSEYVAAVRQKKTNNASQSKPMIIAVNHINFLEVPILVSHVYPTPVVGIMKDTTWNNPVMAFISDTFNAIPLNRNGSYLETFRRVKEAINNGAFIGIAPEGQRSNTGILQKGKAGILQLALLTNTPIIPVAHYGGQNFWRNVKRFRRTEIRYKVGRPFLLKTQNGRIPRAERETYIDEVMIQIAALLPEDLRGEYAGRVHQACDHLEFL